MNEHPVDSPRAPESVSRTRFVTVCQQLLALAVVATVLTPAARTISLDVQPANPSAGGGVSLQAEESDVPDGPVDPEVHEVNLTTQQGAKAQRPAPRSTLRKLGSRERVESKPIATEGYTAVGVTWQSGVEIAEEDISFQLRTRKNGAWSEWAEMTYHDEHGPDAATAEATGVRQGSDAVLVGEVDDVQVRVDAAGKAPADLRVSVINPGEAKQTKREAPAIETTSATTDTSAGTDDTSASTDDTSAEDTSTDDTSAEGELQLAAAGTPKPTIYSRAQWGANEEMRDRGSLSYYEVHTGFVHHTVSSNNYTRSDVPSIIRSIYAYHTRSLGWSDIGYNFLVDKFGRVWEGRAGGVDRPVVGAHTRGYNDVSFAMSAIGNYQTAFPTQAMINAYGQLFAWKLSLHGVKPQKWRAYYDENGKRFSAINGHRDAGATACPGQHLYDRLRDIRKSAKNKQAGFGGRNLQGHLAAGPSPDIIMRRNSDGRGFVLPLTKGKHGFGTGKLINTGLDLSDARDLLRVGDWDGDGHGDLIIRRKGDGRLFLHRGDGTGRFDGGRAIMWNTGKIVKLTAVGDFDGDGRPDLMGKDRRTLSIQLYRGRGQNGISSGIRMNGNLKGMPVHFGRWDNTDGAPDTLYRHKGNLYVYHGNGPGGYTHRRQVNFDDTRYWAFVGVGNFGDGPHSDIVARDKETAELHFIPGRWNGHLDDPIPLGRDLTGFSMIQ